MNWIRESNIRLDDKAIYDEKQSSKCKKVNKSTLTVMYHHTDTKKGKSIKGSKLWEAEPCAGDRSPPLPKKCVYVQYLENE